MAIRVVHAPIGAAGLAGFATGVGRAQERKNKFALALNARANRFRTGSRVGAAKPVGGKFADPLAGATGQQAIMIRSQQRRNAQDRAAGRAPKFPGADPVFTSQEDIDAAAKKKAADDKFDRGVENEERINDRERQEAEDRADFDRRIKGIEGRLPVIPPHLVGSEHERELRKLQQAERDLRNKRKFNLDDPETQEGLADIREDWEEIIEGAGPAKDPLDQLNEDTVSFDPVTKKWVRGGGTHRLVDGEPVLIEQPKPEKEAKPEDSFDVKRSADIKRQKQIMEDYYFENGIDIKDPLMTTTDRDKHIKAAKAEADRLAPITKEDAEPEEVIRDKDELPVVDKAPEAPAVPALSPEDQEEADANAIVDLGDIGEDEAPALVDPGGSVMAGFEPLPGLPGFFRKGDKLIHDGVSRLNRDHKADEAAALKQMREGGAAPGAAPTEATSRSERIAKTAANRKADALRRKKLPKGVPEGSEWVDVDKIRLPDGTIVRKK